MCRGSYDAGQPDQMCRCESIILMIAFSMMTNTPEKQAAFAEKAGTYKYLPFGAWALSRCSK